jgi:hypothetical protein
VYGCPFTVHSGTAGVTANGKPTTVHRTLAVALQTLAL